MDEEERNYCCLILLLSRVGLENLRKLFIIEWDTIGGFDPWTDCPQNGTDLLTKFTPLPYETAKVQSGDSKTWDLSLIVKVLLNSRPPFVYIPNKALVDGLIFLKETRNKLCHTTSGKIKTAEFSKLYNEACMALMLVGASPNDFRKVEEDVHQPLNEVFALLKKLTTQDKDIFKGIGGTKITINGVVKAVAAGGAMLAWAAGSAYFLNRYRDDPETVIRLVQGAVVPSSLATGAMIYVIGILPGSFKIVVRVYSLQSLELLWDRYKTGNLEKELQYVIVTDDLKKLGMTVGKSALLVSVSISEDEYLKAKDELQVEAIKRGQSKLVDTDSESSAKTDENVGTLFKKTQSADVASVKMVCDSEMEDEGALELPTTSSGIKYETGPFKVILIGRSGVGKSTLFLRIRDGKFHDNIQGEVFDFFDKKIEVTDNKSVKMMLYDTAGMEKWQGRSITRSYYLGSLVALILYSADDMDSVDDLNEYITYVNMHAPSAKKFLIRNKIDLEDQAVMEEKVEETLIKGGTHSKTLVKHNISAKNGQGIDDLLKAVGITLLESCTEHKSYGIGVRSTRIMENSGERIRLEAANRNRYQLKIKKAC